MSTYTGIYYTGESSQGYEAAVSLGDENHLSIMYRGESSWPVYVQWELKGIKKISTGGGKTTYQYGGFPYQSISTSDAALISLLDLQLNSFDKHYGNLLNGGWRLRAGLGLFLLGLIALFYFVLLPGTTSFLAGQMPQQTEIVLGEELYQSVMADYQKDVRLSELANAFAEQLDFNTTYPIQITVVKATETNAFALPGGQIVIYDRLLYKLESPEAFAALLGHEVAHVTQRHSLKSISRNLSNHLFLSLILGDLNGINSVLVENVQMLGELSYSRELEQEADEEALKLLYANQLDQQGLVHLMETLQEAHDSFPIRLLSSHPLTEDRIKFAQEHVVAETVAKNIALEEIWNAIKLNSRSSN